jgi:tRNA A37 N6-isopentenylltransferase MiaA
MQRATRQYARRQLIWFRREPAAEWMTVRDWDWVEPLAEQIVARLKGTAISSGSCRRDAEQGSSRE